MLVLLRKHLVAKNMFSTYGIINAEFVEKLRHNSFILNHYRKMKICVYVCVAYYVLVNNVDRFNSSQCLLNMPVDSSKIFREPENCDMCRDIKQITKVRNISPLEFYREYAKPQRPVVVSDGALNWPALKLFTFDFFRKLHEAVDVNDSKRKNCQFFPYKTEFKDLGEVFNMSKERAELAPGEKSWYVGWSNCNDNAGKILQTYYAKPYFLGNNSENIALSWTFMGGPGNGAQMHVDNVHYPSWQAQLSGRKLWKLAPPPECYYICQQLHVTVEPGEIIVADTNRWYHQTFVLPGSISITIGSEFD